jgi:4-amino-4-deoxy-L-arabinose transferase-like glycosyltransferase
MEFYKKNKNTIFISIILLSSLALGLYYLHNSPFHNDEAVYAEIIDEFIRNPAPVPYFMGHITSWKPPLGFAVYSLFIYLFNAVQPGMAIEILYRLPPLIFGVLSAIALYFMARKLYGEEVALLSSLIFAINPIAIVVSDTLILETIASFLLISGILLYMEGEKDRRYMYYAGLIAALLFFTKTILAFLLPALGIAYYFGSRKMSHDAEMGRSFLISLSGVPLAMLLYAIIFQIYAPLGQGADIRVSYIYDMFRAYPQTGLSLLTNTVQFLKLTLPWSIMFFGGLLLMNIKKREDRFLYLWLVLMLVFLGAGQFYTWYYIYILPPFSIICSRAALQIKNSKFFVPVLFLLLILSLPNVSNPEFTDYQLSASSVIAERVEAGYFLRNATNVMMISSDGLPEVVFYKFHGDPEPNYSALQMKVLNPFSNEGYIAYGTFAEPALGFTKVQNLTDASQVKQLITNSSGNAYVLMDSGTYGVYSASPFENYHVVLNTSHGSYIIIKRVS